MSHILAGVKRPYRWFFGVLGVVVATPVALWALNPGVPPGSNFNMTYWQLQLPIGSTDDPTTISSSSLQGGYENFSYFFTESGDGAMVMKVPGDSADTGCVTTSGSTHCRTELREVDPSTGNGISWDPNAATNRLTATVAVEAADNGTYGTVIGQIHMDASASTKPVIELYYAPDGTIRAGVERTRAGEDEAYTIVGNVPLGQQFTYEIEYSGGVLKVAINGNFTTLSTYSLDTPPSYFKAGNYDQGSNASDVHFYALAIQH